MKVKFLAPQDTAAGLLPVGTVCEHPDCFLHADIGNAVEHDDEAREAVARWREAKRKPVLDPRQDTRFAGFTFVGRAVPTVFTLPSGEVLTVGTDVDGRWVVEKRVASDQGSVASKQTEPGPDSDH